jgi:phospholipase C
MGSSRQDGRRSHLSRRDFLKAGVALGGAGMVLSTFQGRLLEAALAGASAGSLSDVKHVVILMQENRSFDHYFGRMSDVLGFGDTTTHSSYAGGPATNPATVFNQSMAGLYQLADGSSSLEPFHLFSDPSVVLPSRDGQTTNDITHEWGAQHISWNNGAMDRWAAAHLNPTIGDGMSTYRDYSNPLNTTAYLQGTSVPNGILTMGYYDRSDLAFYYALADAFTICDRYHCSVLGPTDPNRLMSMSASLGADGREGGPVLFTHVQDRPNQIGTLGWTTYPERLTQAGVSWKVYQDPSSNALFNVLPYFKNFAKPQNAEQVQNAAQGLAPVYPAEFQADVLAGTLPTVSWIMPPAPNCEHPATPPEYGEYLVSQILQALLLNPGVWAQTVFLVVYDENGGFFDHVAPPTPGGTITSSSGIPSDARYAGEYITGTGGDVSHSLAGIFGPVGLGFRTPAFVISPFSAGGFRCSEVFDHTSTLKFISAVLAAHGINVALPNISPWRAGVVGDMTSALPRLTSPTTAVPALPATSMTDPQIFQQSLMNSLLGTVDRGQGYPPPKSNGGVPQQESVPVRRVC